MTAVSVHATSSGNTDGSDALLFPGATETDEHPSTEDVQRFVAKCLDGSDGNGPSCHICHWPLSATSSKLPKHIVLAAGMHPECARSAFGFLKGFQRHWLQPGKVYAPKLDQKCVACGMNNATLACRSERCKKSRPVFYHLPCLRDTGCAIQSNLLRFECAACAPFHKRYSDPNWMTFEYETAPPVENIVDPPDEKKPKSSRVPTAPPRRPLTLRTSASASSLSSSSSAVVAPGSPEMSSASSLYDSCHSLSPRASPYRPPLSEQSPSIGSMSDDVKLTETPVSSSRSGVDRKSIGTQTDVTDADGIMRDPSRPPLAPPPSPATGTDSNRHTVAIPDLRLPQPAVRNNKKRAFREIKALGIAVDPTNSTVLPPPVSPRRSKRLRSAYA